MAAVAPPTFQFILLCRFVIFVVAGVVDDVPVVFAVAAAAVAVAVAVVVAVGGGGGGGGSRLRRRCRGGGGCCIR